jgi:hypothetical protein
MEVWQRCRLVTHYFKGGGEGGGQRERERLREEREREKEFQAKRPMQN